MDKKIRHDGIVEAIGEGVVRVRFVQDTACASCKVAAQCHTAEAKEKTVDVSTTGNSSRWQVGQHVVVSTYASMTNMAMLLVFGMPLVLMFAVLVATLAAGGGEGLAALLMLASLAVYYFVLWLLRKGIAQKIAFQIEETE